jgi:hypothetical protein
MKGTSSAVTINFMGKIFYEQCLLDIFFTDGLLGSSYDPSAHKVPMKGLQIIEFDCKGNNCLVLVGT